MIGHVEFGGVAVVEAAHHGVHLLEGARPGQVRGGVRDLRRVGAARQQGPHALAQTVHSHPIHGDLNRGFVTRE